MSRHCKLAFDSSRLCVVISKQCREDLDFIAQHKGCNMSSLARNYLCTSIAREKKRIEDGISA